MPVALPFLDDAIAPSLFRTGRVRTVRDADGSDTAWEGVVITTREVELANGRTAGLAPDASLRDRGFGLVAGVPLPEELDFLDHDAVIRGHYPSCEALVRQATGAETVIAFDHNVRSVAGKASQERIRGGQQVQGPAVVVHGDYSLTSAPERLDRLARPPSGNDTLRSLLPPDTPVIDPELAREALAGERRFQIINVWRNIHPEPVATFPLALCDGRSVDPGDLVVFEIHYADRIGENYFARFAEGQRWTTFPGIKRSEALLLKQWDSAGTLAKSNGGHGDAAPDPCTFSFHTAFDDPSAAPDAPDRRSIEVRCIVVH